MSADGQDGRLGVVDEAAALGHEGEDLGAQGGEGHASVGHVASR
jgi:hypothetical protein